MMVMVVLSRKHGSFQSLFHAFKYFDTPSYVLFQTVKCKKSLRRRIANDKSNAEEDKKNSTKWNDKVLLITLSFWLSLIY